MSEPRVEPSVGLSAATLAEIADLERRVLAVDGGRLKLEWGTLRSRPDDVANDVLARDGDGRLIGFAGVYRHGGPEPELTGMIDPDHRRQGLGTRVLATVLTLAAAPTALLVVPRSSDGGRRLVLARGGVSDHAEHALAQRSSPALRDESALRDEPADLIVRPAVEDDRAAVDRLLEHGFGETHGAGDRLAGTLVGELAGRLVACLAVDRHDGDAGVFGFVVEPDLRGRGLGRAVLGRVCRDLWSDGVTGVRLEVEVRNERALGLYTSLGFEPVTTEDYYRLAASS